MITGVDLKKKQQSKKKDTNSCLDRTVRRTFFGSGERKKSRAEEDCLLAIPIQRRTAF